MRILIVGAERFQAEMGDVVRRLLEIRGEACEILLAGDYTRARHSIGDADGVVCQQSFPTHPGTAPEPGETQTGNWAGIALEARWARTPFVLVTPSYHLAERVTDVHQVGEQHVVWPMFALVEPVDADFVAETIVSVVACEQRCAAAA